MSSVLQHLRWRLLRNSLSQLLHGSSLRLFTILGVSLLVWGAVYAVTAEGLRFFAVQNIALGGAIAGVLFDLLFLTLTAGLVFSTSIILFSSLFAAPETAFLLSTPAPADQVFAYKFQGAVAFSSWGFVLLASPILVAYGLAVAAPGWFYLLLPLFFVGFVLLPGSLGALVCLGVVNFLPRRRKQVLGAIAVLLLAAPALWVYRLRPKTWNDAMNRDFVQRLLGEFVVAQGPFAPNHWMSRGLQTAARGDLWSSAYYLALVWSNGLFLYLLTAWTAVRLYRRGYNRVATGGTLRRRYGGAWMDRTLNGLVRFLDPQTRLLLIKDFRTFRRDPAQWAQMLVFSVLLGLYLLIVRRFYTEDIGRTYRNGISLVNLAATALLLCAYTGRFIYPMLSLEGRKFWILGLLPLRRERLVWGKFFFSATWALLIAEILVLFSDYMLAMPGLLLGVHALTVAVLALGLSGLSVGLGACIPNFRETDPSKIAVGFGGTLNLVAGLLFILVVIVLMAVPWHFRVLASEALEPTSATLWWCGAGLLLGLVIGAAAVVVPLRLGIRTLLRAEF